MKTILKDDLFEEGVQTLYKEFGSVKTVKFFQIVGLNRGDTLKEIESITEKMSRDEALDLVKNAK